MKTSSDGHNTENVIDLFTGRPYSSQFDTRFIRLAPELDGLEMLYSNEVSGDKYFSLKVLCWALRADGEVVVAGLRTIFGAEEMGVLETGPQVQRPAGRIARPQDGHAE